MTTYIYFVKCPGCEDEHFDFFDEAKEFAMSCMSKKPVITQTEVNRNDFGECTDSCDLGTVWSWEDTMNMTDDEPATSIFTKDDLCQYIDDTDYEFDALDNSLDFVPEVPVTSGVSPIDNIPDNFRRPLKKVCADCDESLTESGDFDRVRAAAQCSRNCYDFYNALAAKVSVKELRPYAMAADKFVKDTYGLTGKEAEDLLWAGYTVWKQLHECKNLKESEDFDDFDIGPQADEFAPVIPDDVDPADLAPEDDFETSALKPNVTEEINPAYKKFIDSITPITKEEFQKKLESDDIVTIFTGDPRESGIRGRTYEASYADGKYEVSYWDETFADDFTDSYIVETFDTIDELWNYMVAFMDNDDFTPEFNYLAECSSRKPIPEGMTIDQLKEAMEENEDTVECAGCEELFPKEDCFHKDGIGWLCGDCEDRIVRCTWCEELYDRSECRREVDLGWLCSRCEMGIKSRGETLTFREGSYWDDLDESVEDIRTLEEFVKDSINHLINDLGKDPWTDGFTADVIKDLENNYNIYVPEDMERYNHWCDAVASEVSRQVNSDYKLEEAAEAEPEVVHDLGNKYEGGYPDAQDHDFIFDICPECGEEDAFDHSAGFCTSCGFNIN